MAYVPSFECADGEYFNHWLLPPIMESLNNERNRIINKFTLMDYVDEKWIYGSLLMLCSFRADVRAAHQDEIGLILDERLDEGDLW